MIGNSSVMMKLMIQWVALPMLWPVARTEVGKISDR